jgi:hypothetical protein
VGGPETRVEGVPTSSDEDVRVFCDEVTTVDGMVNLASSGFLGVAS